MKATIFMATYNKNDILPNTLFSIIRQKSSIPYEVCIIDDHSYIDPEPIIRKFIPDAKYKRLNKRHGPDVIHSFALELASNDSNILIRQSADVMHGSIDTIEKLCKGVGKKKICMAMVANTKPPLNMYKNFEKHLPSLIKQHRKGRKRSKHGKSQKNYYFFLGAIRRIDYESLKCTNEPHCDVMLSEELFKSKFTTNYPQKLIGFHQQHPQSLAPCSRHETCLRTCFTKIRCTERGWKNFEDYLKKEGLK